MRLGDGEVNQKRAGVIYHGHVPMYVPDNMNNVPISHFHFTWPSMIMPPCGEVVVGFPIRLISMYMSP